MRRMGPASVTYAISLSFPPHFLQVRGSAWNTSETTTPRPRAGYPRYPRITPAQTGSCKPLTSRKIGKSTD